jgi:hypothetical protein
MLKLKFSDKNVLCKMVLCCRDLWIRGSGSLNKMLEGAKPCLRPSGQSERGVGRFGTSVPL